MKTERVGVILLACLVLAGCSGAADSSASSRAPYDYEIKVWNDAGKQMIGSYYYNGLSARQVINDSNDPGEWSHSFHHRKKSVFSVTAEARGVTVYCKIVLNGMSEVKHSGYGKVSCDN